MNQAVFVKLGWKLLDYKEGDPAPLWIQVMRQKILPTGSHLSEAKMKPCILLSILDDAVKIETGSS